jgi:hypothetical protein
MPMSDKDIRAALLAELIASKCRYCKKHVTDEDEKFYLLLTGYCSNKCLKKHAQEIVRAYRRREEGK